jgi:hypothetical protein
MTRSTALRRIGWAAILGILGAALLMPATSLATRPDPAHKIDICHRTDSNANPYVPMLVDIASSGYVENGHATRHLGPVWNPTLKDQHIKWGDIIPPYTYNDFTFPGLNWNDAGQAFYNNHCAIPASSKSPRTATEPPTQPPTTPPSQAPSTSPEQESISASASIAPSASVEGAHGTPRKTPPPTDTGPVAAPSTQAWQTLLGLVAGLLAIVLLATRPRPRHR